MMKQREQGLEQITVRRAKVADTDKVRYRVYSTPTDFIAVIAESALMAVKVSGISKPHKIVRDLPTEGIAIEAQKMAAIEEKPQRVAFAMQKPDAPKRIVAELPVLAAEDEAKKAAFKPMGLRDLQNQSMARARILPPEMLTQIIEEHAKAAHPAPVVDAEAAPAAYVPPPEPVVAEDDGLSPNDRLLKMSQEVLASAPPPVAADADDKELSPEEVAKLLNE